jgi:hypothetical protein
MTNSERNIGEVISSLPVQFIHIPNGVRYASNERVAAYIQVLEGWHQPVYKELGNGAGEVIFFQPEI